MQCAASEPLLQLCGPLLGSAASALPRKHRSPHSSLLATVLCPLLGPWTLCMQACDVGHLHTLKLCIRAKTSLNTKVVKPCLAYFQYATTTQTEQKSLHSCICSLPSAFTEGHRANRSAASLAERTLGTRGRQSTQLLLSRASSTAASSCCMRDGAANAVCSGMPSGKRASRCARALATPNFATVSYLRKDHQSH